MRQKVAVCTIFCLKCIGAIINKIIWLLRYFFWAGTGTRSLMLDFWLGIFYRKENMNRYYFDHFLNIG